MTSMFHTRWVDSDGCHVSDKPYTAEQLTWVLNHASFRGVYVDVSRKPLKPKVWVCVAVDKQGEVWFQGTGDTQEAAIKAMYENARQMLEDRAEPGDPPVTIDVAKETVDYTGFAGQDFIVTQPFDIEV